MITITKSMSARSALTIRRRSLTTTLVAAIFASATTAASADPLSALLGSLFGQRPGQQPIPSYQTAAVSAYAYAPAASAAEPRPHPARDRRLRWPLRARHRGH